MPELKIISKGKEYMCLYDEEDHDLISRFTWSLNTGGYAVTQIDGKNILMHRLILGVVDHPEIEVDHIHHNKLDNRRSMIRTGKLPARKVGHRVLIKASDLQKCMPEIVSTKYHRY